MKSNIVSALVWCSPGVDTGAKTPVQTVNAGGDPTKHRKDSERVKQRIRESL